VLDTNVIVAGLAYPAGMPGRIVAAWRNGTLEVVLSPWTLTECERVLPRLRQFTAMPPAEIRDLVEILSFSAEVTAPNLAALRTAGEARLRDAADEPAWPPCSHQARTCWSPVTRTCWRFRTGSRYFLRQTSVPATPREPALRPP